jgi:hypothetical protein
MVTESQPKNLIDKPEQTKKGISIRGEFTARDYHDAADSSRRFSRPEE